MSKNNETAHSWLEVGKRHTIPQLSNVIFLKIAKNMFRIAYDIAKYHSSFHLKKWIRSRETGLQILAMAVRFARNFFFKRKVHHTVPYLQGRRDTVWWYWNITKRSLEKAALVREKFPNFCDKTKLPTQYVVKPKITFIYITFMKAWTFFSRFTGDAWTLLAFQ